MKNVLHQGAESRIYVQDFMGKEVLVKERFQKKYRNAELDASLTKDRIKAECRTIVRCKQAGIQTPAIYFVDIENRLIYMEHFKNSITVKEYLYKLENEGKCSGVEVSQVAKHIGTAVGKMHLANMVHGDLTTSNMLLVNDGLVMIDFGLSHSDESPEDKGVDLYVLERALLSTHANTDSLFKELLHAYAKTVGPKNYAVIFDKFEEVRARGRKRTMVG